MTVARHELMFVTSCRCFRQITACPWRRTGRLAAVHEAVHDGAVNAADAFAGREEAGNRLIGFNVKHGGRDVRGHAAHAVMDLRAHFGDVEGRFADRLCFLVEATAEVGVLAGCVSSL